MAKEMNISPDEVGRQSADETFEGLLTIEYMYKDQQHA